MPGVLESSGEVGRVEVSDALSDDGDVLVRLLLDAPSRHGHEGEGDSGASHRRLALGWAVLKQNQLVRVDRHGQVARLSQDPLLQSPSSVAFGRANCDRHTLFVANFSIYQKLGGLDPKDLKPGILTLPVNKPGLPLP